MKKWQISKPKIVDWYLDFSKEPCTTLKNAREERYLNYRQLKRKFLSPNIQVVVF